MKVAVVHDWFKANGGAEKVAGSIIELYSHDEVTVYTLFNKFSANDSKLILQEKPVNTSVMQWMPGIANYYRYLLPIMPWLIERFKLRNYDVVISTSHAVAKGIGVSAKTLHICYCHSPMRYVWDMYDDYVAHHSIGKFPVYRWLIRAIRKWDFKSSSRVHYFIANSEHIRERIQKSYGRDAKVIYPPVRTQQFALFTGKRKDYYLCLGRLVPYKKIDLVARSFAQMPDKQLIIIGEGYGSEGFQEVLRNAPNVKWLGFQEDAALIRYIQEARACIFAAKEDFGISCVEVQACGTPVIALRYGGYKETVLDGISGYFFEEQTETDIIKAVNKLEALPLTDHAAISDHAEKFSEERFKLEMAHFVDICYANFYDK